MSDNPSPNELIEEGVGLIARGLFRANSESGPEEAVGLGSAVLTTIRGMWLDFVRQQDAGGTDG